MYKKAARNMPSRSPWKNAWIYSPGEKHNICTNENNFKLNLWEENQVFLNDLVGHGCKYRKYSLLADFLSNLLIHVCKNGLSLDCQFFSLHKI